MRLPEFLYQQDFRRSLIAAGAGSPAEINLRDHDIVNLRMAKAAAAACLLVGDIDRGGVFASLLGTMELLEPGERRMFKGFLINKFRGDLSLLQPGVEMIEHRLGLPCVGVVPYLHALGLDEEDSVAVEDRLSVGRSWGTNDEASPHRRLRIGVIALPHMANFTDLDALAAESSVALAFLERPEDIDRADVLILPGSKQTTRIMQSPLVSAAPPILYAALVLPRLGEIWPAVSRPTLNGVVALLGSPAGATIAWVHFLAFDLFVGRWIYLDSQERRVGAWLMAPVLFLTLMLGPAGFLLYLIVRSVAVSPAPAKASLQSA